jgi:hypothetical protein
VRSSYVSHRSVTAAAVRPLPNHPREQGLETPLYSRVGVRRGIVGASADSRRSTSTACERAVRASTDSAAWRASGSRPSPCGCVSDGELAPKEMIAAFARRRENHPPSAAAAPITAAPRLIVSLADGDSQARTEMRSSRFARRAKVPVQHRETDDAGANNQRQPIRRVVFWS